MPVVTKTLIPGNSVLQPAVAAASFCDAYAAALPCGRHTATEIFLHAINATPSWVNALMSLRNVVVRQFGLKDVGAMRDTAQKPASAYREGDQIGIFTIVSQSEDELVLGIDDRHLDIRVSVLKNGGELASGYIVSTVVKVNNLLGHIYMIPVGRIHPHVVKAMMRRTIV